MTVSQTPGISIYPVTPFRRGPVESVQGVEGQNRGWRVENRPEKPEENRSASLAAEVQTYSRKGLGNESPKLGWNLDLLA